MDRVEQASRLKIVEQAIEDLNKHRVGIDTSYFNEGELSLTLNSEDFNYKSDYNGVNVEFSKKLMLEFIDSQIATFEDESKMIIGRLTDGS